jgi:type III pantothenate kinase
MIRMDDELTACTQRIARLTGVGASFVAVDVGNSQMKLGQFARQNNSAALSANKISLSEPIATLELPIVQATGLFDLQSLAAWCEQHLSPDTHWSIGSVHRGAGSLLAATIAAWGNQLNINCPMRLLTYQDIPFAIRVDEPARVGIDRLLAAVAANRLRAPDRAAIVVDMGTAITVDLVEADGAFAGGAILPGVGMAGRALAEQTDALPHVVLEHSETPPMPLGKSTKAAIEAGLYWGTVGAVGEIVSRLAAGLPAAADVFITGGASRSVAKLIDEKCHVQYVPHLVLAGIALLDDAASGGSQGPTA